jgi:hypothetical protein
VVVGDQPGEGRPLEERRVGRHHDHRARRRTRGLAKRVEPDPDRMAGPLLGLLHRQQRVGNLCEDVRRDLVAAVADDRDDALGLQRGRGGEHVPDHAPPAQAVEHLAGLRPHPGAAAGGEHDDGRRRGVAHAALP